MTDQTEADNEIVEAMARAIVLAAKRDPDEMKGNFPVWKHIAIEDRLDAALAVVKPLIARKAREKALREAAALVHGRDGFDGKCLVWSYRAHANRKDVPLARFAVASSEAILTLLDGGDND